MLFGAMIKNLGNTARLEEIEAKLFEDGRIEGQVVKKAPVFFANLKSGPRYPTPVIPSQLIQDGVMGVWQGEIYNRDSFPQWQESNGERPGYEQDEAKLFAKGYLSSGNAFLKCLNGKFAFAIYKEENQEMVLGRDHLGVENLYVYEDKQMFVFCTKISPILETPGVPRELNYDSLRRSLIFSYNPGWDTLFKGIRKVKPGCLLYLDSKGIEEQTFWYLSFKDVQQKDEVEIAQSLRELFADAVNLRMLSSTSPGVFISGGLDSSGVACFMRQSFPGSISSYSYRTLQVSYDESAYARIVADACRFDHHEVVYKPEDVKLIETIVQIEDEPFCNLGISVATFLLGREAQGLAGQIFCGSGGDELFAGHPVYSADKIAAFTDRVPQVLKSPVTALFCQLPDSDKKLNMTVKLKRFSESLSYLKEFGTFRWRIYYSLDELDRLFVPDLAIDRNSYISLFSDVLAMYQEADGKDALSRSLFVDFKTEVNFHMRLKDLVGYFGVQSMFPMLDYRLVEYAATVPSSLKIRRYGDSKYIEKPVLAGVIPDQILNRKDKLGHSIPFKNWLRCEPAVKGLVLDILSDDRVKSRGLFNMATIQAMWDNHQNLRQNNSHRLWMLAVLELWLVANGF